MRWVRLGLAVTVANVAVAAPRGARAQAPEEAQAVARAQPAGPVGRSWLEAPPPDDEERRLDERTALTLGARRLKIGVIAFEYGITDRVNVGIDPPYWVLRAFSSVLIPNAHVKVVGVRRAGLWVAGAAAVYYASLTKDDQASGQLLAVPLSLFVSARATPKLWLHPEATYTFVNVWGTGDVSRLTFEGAAPMRTAQVGLTAQYRLTNVVSLTLMGRYQAYTGNIEVSGTGTSQDGATTATVNARLLPATEHPWSVVPGVALLWKHVRLAVGAGYGSYFLPGMDVVVRGAGFVPEASLFVVL